MKRIRPAGEEGVGRNAAGDAVSNICCASWVISATSSPKCLQITSSPAASKSRSNDAPLFRRSRKRDEAAYWVLSLLCVAFRGRGRRPDGAWVAKAGENASNAKRRRGPRSLHRREPVFAFASGLVTSRAQSMNNFAIGLNVRSFKVTIATGLG